MGIGYHVVGSGRNLAIRYEARLNAQFVFP